MKTHILAISLLLIGSQTAFAATCTTPACKEAAAQYASDKKLCAEGSTSSIRMQCLRDAKAEYDRAMAAGKAAPTASSSPAPAKAPACVDCGTVTSVRVVEKKGEGGAIGMIGGGIAGGLLGSQIGKGSGKTAATVVGAAGGAYAGKKIEEQVRSARVWVVQVRLDQGATRSFEFDHDPGFAAGSPVRLSGNSIVAR